MSQLVMWNLIVGFLMPTVIAVIQQPKFSEPVRAGLTAAFSIVAGFITAYLNDSFTKGDVVGSILITGVAAITFYKGFWKPTNVAPSIEAATSASGERRNDRGEIDLIRVVVIIILVLVAIWLAVELFDLNVRGGDAHAQIANFVRLL